jgi:hypothetical protein
LGSTGMSGSRVVAPRCAPGLEPRFSLMGYAQNSRLEVSRRDGRSRFGSSDVRDIYARADRQRHR